MPPSKGYETLARLETRGPYSFTAPSPCVTRRFRTRHRSRNFAHASTPTPTPQPRRWIACRFNKNPRMVRSGRPAAGNLSSWLSRGKGLLRNYQLTHVATLYEPIGRLLTGRAASGRLRATLTLLLRSLRSSKSSRAARHAPHRHRHGHARPRA